MKQENSSKSQSKKQSTSVEMSCENGIYIVKKENQKHYELIMANYRLTNIKFESVKEANEYVKSKPIELIIGIWGILTELKESNK